MARGRVAGDAGASRASSRVRRRIVAVLAFGACFAMARAQADVAIPPIEPAGFALAAGGNLYVGNGTRVPGPVGANGACLLDERVHVPLAIARRDLKLRLLATVDGDALSVGGAAQLANQAHVRGSLVAARGVVVGVSARVDGDVVATGGAVRIARLASVGADVYADREFKADRDVVVGAPGSRVEVRGDAIIRDRSEYFATVLYEGTLSLLGIGAPVFHASVVAVAPGTLAAPGMPAWKLTTPSLPAADPGTADITVTKAASPLSLPPGRYGVVTLAQEARVVLSPGVYEIEALVAQSDARLRVDLAGAADTLELRVRRDVRPGRRFVVDVGGDDAARRARASRMRTIAGGAFQGDQDVVWVGAVRAEGDIDFGKHTTLVGSAWSKRDLHVGRDAVLDWVPFAE
jgi:hypothetical protein